MAPQGFTALRRWFSCQLKCTINVANPLTRFATEPDASGSVASPGGQLAGPAEAVEERPEPALGHAHRHADQAFEQSGLAQIAEVDRVESGVADQLLGEVAG